jgi:nucleoside 2-deoxyribosyltransferase
MITIVGGVYHERCMAPAWQEIYGSAGRAATAIVRAGGTVDLFTYLDGPTKDVIGLRAAYEGFQIHPTDVSDSAAFSYVHGLSTPEIYAPLSNLESIPIKAAKVVRFGMLEGDSVVHGDYVVYDPQNPGVPRSFSANGSTANHLALILNRSEARAICGSNDLTTEEMARTIAVADGAEVVVIKMGPLGALVYANGSISQVPAYSTDRVWKLGSGDNFVAHFALAWLEDGLSAHDAANLASRATAYYCEHQGFATRSSLSAYAPAPLPVSQRFQNGYKPKLYLAGPFFSLAQLWLVEEARKVFLSMGVDVFSPYHDVGPGPADQVVQKDIDAIHECDLMFAIGDGLDAGTLYEIGYARALNRPVIMYTENESEEDKKMMEGSDCVLCDDFVTAIYKTVWIAVSL